MRNPWPWNLWAKGRIAIPVVHWGREHYIPIKPLELLERILDRENEKNEKNKKATEAEAEESGGTEQEKAAVTSPYPVTIDQSLFRSVGRKIVSDIHQQYRSHHERLVRLYGAFDPDRDLPLANRLGPPIDSEVESAIKKSEYRQLFVEIADSLHHANYRRLKPSEIQEALNAASHWGVRLRIRFSSFRKLEVYARGDIVTKRLKRNWYPPFQYREVDVPIYQRLVVVFRTKEMQNLPELLDPDCVHVRMFKNIPKADVDMMLPGSQVRLTWFDTGKIGIPTMWGLVMLASKLAKSFWLLALLGAVKVLSSFMVVIAIVGASLFYGIKSVFSYSTAKRRYQLNVAQNLYYQNLDNNLGALLRLIDEAEQQEACESILAYYVVLMHGGGRAMASSEIDAIAESILQETLGIAVDFDVADAIRDLAIAGILQFEDEGWRCLSLVEALNKSV
jgi:hypothetical protein